MKKLNNNKSLMRQEENISKIFYNLIGFKFYNLIGFKFLIYVL